jgi:hypothetical protein
VKRHVFRFSPRKTQECSKPPSFFKKRNTFWISKGGHIVGSGFLIPRSLEHIVNFWNKMIKEYIKTDGKMCPRSLGMET